MFSDFGGGRVKYTSDVPKTKSIKIPESDSRGEVDEFGPWIADSLIQDAVELVRKKGVDLSPRTEEEALALVAAKSREILESENRRDLLGNDKFEEELRGKITSLRKVILDLLR